MGQKILYKTDKNGTKYYHCADRCPRCGGTGIVEIYRPVNGGDCFQCWGSGIIEWDDKEYTPEYAAKLEAQRQKREAKRIAKLEAELPAKQVAWLTREGISQDGMTYIFLGNTYEIKDELKALGAKFDYKLGWHIDHKVENYQILEFNIMPYLVRDMFNGYDFDRNFVSNFDMEAMKKAEYKKLNNIKSSEFIGSLNDKIELTVTLKFWVNFESIYGTQTLYSFLDEDNNIITWKTSKWLDLEKDTKVSLKGTIKDHSEYKGEKQTILTRCKVGIIKEA